MILWRNDYYYAHFRDGKVRLSSIWSVAGESPFPSGEKPTCFPGSYSRGPGGSHSPDDHEERHCKGFRRDAVDQGLQRAGEGAHRLGDHLPGGVGVGEGPTGFRGRDAADTDHGAQVRLAPRLRVPPLHTHQVLLTATFEQRPDHMVFWNILVKNAYPEISSNH